MVGHCLDMTNGNVLHWPFPDEAWARPPFQKVRGIQTGSEESSRFLSELESIISTPDVLDNRHCIDLLRTTWRVMRIDGKQNAGDGLTDADGKFIAWMYK